MAMIMSELPVTQRLFSRLTSVFTNSLLKVKVATSNEAQRKFETILRASSRNGRAGIDVNDSVYTLPLPEEAEGFTTARKASTSFAE